MAKMVSDHGLAGVNLQGREYVKNQDGEFDVDDRDVPVVQRNFGLRPKDEAAPEPGKK